MAKKRKLGVRLKLALTFAAIVIIGAIIAFPYHIYTLTEGVKKTYIDKGLLLAESLSSRAQEPLIIDDVYTLQSLAIDTLKLTSGVEYCFIQDAKGVVKAYTLPGGVPKSLAEFNIPPRDHPQVKILEDPKRGKIYDIAVPMKVAGTIHIGLRSISFLALAFTQLQNILGLVAIGTVVVIVLATVVANRITLPLKELSSVAVALGTGNLERKAVVTTEDEFSDLASAINDTIDRLKRLLISEEEREILQTQIIEFLKVVSAAAEGDLREKATVTVGILGTLADAFNFMLDSLTELVSRTRNTAIDVGRYSNEITKILRNLGKGANEQLDQIKTTGDVIGDIAISIDKVSTETEGAMVAARSTSKAALKGGKSVSEIIDGIQLLRATVQAINRKMKTLTEKLMEIGAITQVINDIASQTNLLALNASIEASRAGEHGKGFMVIAEEIRKLADRAGSATKDIGNIIGAIQVEAGEVATALEEETRHVETEAQLASDTGSAFKEIESAVAATASSISSIHTAAEEQARLEETVMTAMEAIFRVALSVVKMTEGSVDISQSLGETSQELLNAIGRFRLLEAPEEAAIKVSMGGGR